MYSKQAFKGRWQSIKGKVREKWGQLSERDLASVEGNLENLIWIVQKRTGEPKREIEDYVDRCCKKPSAAVMESVIKNPLESNVQGVSTVEYPVVARQNEIALPVVENKVTHPSVMDVVASVFSAGFLTGVIFGLLARAPF